VRKLSADYIFPLTQPPVKNGIVVVDGNGEVTEDVINPANIDYSITEVEHHEGFICPGFINAHCHLELSYLKGKIKEHSGLNNFIVDLQPLRKVSIDDEMNLAAQEAEKEMMRNGIVAVADICNDNSTFALKNRSSIRFHSFIESFASNPEKADFAFNKALALYNEIRLNEHNNHASITQHAPYSLSKNLFQKIMDFAESTGNILSMHHQESEEENKFFMPKGGTINERQFSFGVERSDFADCGLRPLNAIADYLPKDNALQLVHNTVTRDFDIAYAQENFGNLFWCFCPNANLYIEQKLPDFALFFNKKCKITIGTDSFASNKTLSLLDELKTIRANVPFIPLNELLKWASTNGAEFLQIADTFGSLQKGKRPGILLLEDVNLATLHITRDSSVRVLA